jgi:hypothetical protein
VGCGERMIIVLDIRRGPLGMERMGHVMRWQTNFFLYEGEGIHIYQALISMFILFSSFDLQC